MQTSVTLEITDPAALQRAAAAVARDRGLTGREWSMMRVDDPIRRDVQMVLEAAPGMEIVEWE